MIKLIEIVTTLKEIVNLLVAKQYKNIFQMDYLKNYSESELTESILDYGGVLTLPPTKAFEECEVYETENPNIVRVDFDLWFDGKKSLLTLSCTIYRVGKKCKFSIDNIRIQ